MIPAPTQVWLVVQVFRGILVERLQLAGHRPDSTQYIESCCAEMILVGHNNPLTSIAAGRSSKMPHCFYIGREPTDGQTVVGILCDYQIATPGIATKARKVSVYKNKRFSDHAPLTIDYDASWP